MGEPFISSMLVYLVSTVGIIIAAYYTTLWIGKKSRSFARNRHISLMEKNMLPGGISISVIKIGNHVYIIANTGKSIEKLDQMSMEEWQSMKIKNHRMETDPNLVENTEKRPFRFWSKWLQSWDSSEKNKQKGDEN